jgi:uncharacterized protein (TIGR03435 family)
LALWAAATACAFGQTDAPGPAFEVASVKVSAPLPNGVVMVRMGGGPDSSDPGRITYAGVTIKSLVARAYDVKEFQVEGPSWLDGERYDVIATIPKGASKDQVGPMMQRLLAERFKLTLHHESKPMAVYTLSVAKTGAKLQEIDPNNPPPLPPPPPGSPPPPPPPPPGPGSSPGGSGPPRGPGLRIMMGMNMRHLAGNATIARLCDLLSNLTDRPVIDLTDLKGTYTFDLSWTPDETEKMAGGFGRAMAMSGVPAGAAAASGPAAPPPPTESSTDPGQTLVQALQTNYGLKLEAKRNPADILVIDHAEKVPTEN